MLPNRMEALACLKKTVPHATTADSETHARA